MSRVLLQRLGLEPPIAIGHALSAVYFESPLMQAQDWALVTPDALKAQKKDGKYLPVHSYRASVPGMVLSTQ